MGFTAFKIALVIYTCLCIGTVIFVLGFVTGYHAANG